MSKQHNQSSLKGNATPLGVNDPNIKEILKTRAFYRVVIFVPVIFLLLACLTIISSATRKKVDIAHRPRAIVLVVPYLHYNTLEMAMASNKAPFISMLSASGGVNTRVRTVNTDLKASLVTLLSGNVNSTGEDLVGSTSFLGTLKKANMKPVLLAPSTYWSGNEVVNDSCEHVGLYDTECSGTNCSTHEESSYCNAVKKLVSCNNKAQIYTEDLLEAFKYLIKTDGDILYAHTEVTSSSSSPLTNEGRLAEFSDLSVMDGTFGKLLLAANARSQQNAENWLIVLAGAGGDGVDYVPLFMAAYADGELVRFGRIPENATLADVNPTVLNWFALCPKEDRDRVRGMCSTGVEGHNCDTTTN